MPLKPQYRAGDIVVQELPATNFFGRVPWWFVVFVLVIAAGVGWGVGYIVSAQDIADAIDKSFVCEIRK